MTRGKKTRNKGRDAIGDYYKTNQAYTKENRARQKDEAAPKGLKRLSSTEKIYVAVILLGLLGIVIKYVVF